jgi:CheY-like chemotaxis protein
MSHSFSCVGETLNCGNDFDCWYRSSISSQELTGQQRAERSEERLWSDQPFEFLSWMIMNHGVVPCCRCSRAIPNCESSGKYQNGLEAVRKVQEFEVDLILLDIGLPTLNGIAAAKEMRKLSPQSKILFVSQESSPDMVEEALRTGEGYLVKADAGSELLTAVNAVVQGKRFVSSRFVGFPEASDNQVPECVGRNNDSPLRGQEKEIAHRHEVLFYSDDRYFLEELAQFVERALEAGNAAIVAANESQRNSLRRRLQASGLDIAAATEQGRYVALDAAEMVSTIMVDGMPDAVRLLQGFGNLVRAAEKAAKGNLPRVVACGQIAPLLLAQGKTEAAIQVEKLTNHLAVTYGLDILCGYPQASFQNDTTRKIFQQICAEHSAVDSR